MELDTDFTEYVTFSPPTGLVGQDATIKTIVEKTGDLLLIIIPVVIIIAGMSYVTVQVIKRKKFYKWRAKHKRNSRKHTKEKH